MLGSRRVYAHVSARVTGDTWVVCLHNVDSKRYSTGGAMYWSQHVPFSGFRESGWFGLEGAFKGSLVQARAGSRDWVRLRRAPVSRTVF